MALDFGRDVSGTPLRGSEDYALTTQSTYGTNFEDALSNPAIMDGLNGV